jgi:hypothetical protein
MVDSLSIYSSSRARTVTGRDVKERNQRHIAIATWDSNEGLRLGFFTLTCNRDFTARLMQNSRIATTLYHCKHRRNGLQLQIRRELAIDAQSQRQKLHLASTINNARWQSSFSRYTLLDNTYRQSTA